MSSRSAKRARNASDNSTVGHDVRESDIPSLVESLDVNTMARLLIVAAKAYPTIASLVENETGRIAAVERARVVDFNYLSKDAWKTLNVTYDRLRDSHAYEMVGEVMNIIEQCFEII